MDNTVSIETILIENAALKAELSEAREKISWLMEQLSDHRRKIYGISSEKSAYDCKNEQLTYIDDDPPGLLVIHEKEVSEPAPRGREKPKKLMEMSTRLPAGIPVEVIQCVIPEDELQEYGGRMHAIGKELVRRDLKFTPPKATIVEYWRMAYADRDSELSAEKATIIKAPVPPPVIKGAMCSPETVAHIVVQKCVMGSPIYRQWQDWRRRGVPITKQTMASWLIRCSEDYFEPIYNELHRRLLRNTLLYSDDTVVQVLKEPGKSAQSDSRMWLYRTGSDAVNPIVMYDYQPDRRKERPMEFLKGFSGYLVTDGFAAYHSLPENIISVGCFAHVRTAFDKALKCLKNTERPGSLAMIGKEFCNKIFDIDRDTQDMEYDKRRKVRIEKAIPILDEFHAWLKSVEPYVSTKSKLGKAVGYALNQWMYLIRYLDDGRIECSNNRSERSVKVFVINRKNFLFADTVAGGRALAVMHTLTETAKESKLDPFKYLTFVLRQASAGNIRKDDGLLTSLLPENAPAFCREVSPD